MTPFSTTRTARALRRIAIAALLLTVGVATASAQVKTRDHRDQKRKPPPPPPPDVQPPDAPPPPPPPAAWDSKGWQMLGEVQVAGKKTRATIPVGAYEGRFDQLTLVVLDADVEVKKLVVHFGNDDVFDPKIKHKFAEGTRTRAIDLPGNDRIITRIDLTLKGVKGSGRATVQVWGRDTRGGKDDYKVPEPKFNSKGWEKLGTIDADKRARKDTIVVGRDDGRFDKVTFVVRHDDLEIHDILITFGNGETFSPDTRMYFKEDTRTAVIDLPGEKRFIQKIEFAYKNVGRGRKAQIEAWGMPAKDDAPPPPKWEPAGWEKLGELVTDKRSRRDTIKVGREGGRFEKVTFVVRDDDLEIHGVTITFGNGETFSPELRMWFRENSRTAVIDLPGERRFIAKIEFDYKNVGRGKKATIEAWGLPTKKQGGDAPPPPKFDPTGWEKLGTLKTGKRGRRDTIKVGKKAGAVTKVTFVVRDDDLEVFDVKITFGNGEVFSPNVRMYFAEDTRTGVIDLPGEARFIKTIEFDYKNIGRGKKASIVAWGLTAKAGDHGGGGGRVDTRDHRKQRSWDSKGWEMLGEQEVNGQNDFDVINVGAREGSFKQITLAVVDGAMDLQSMTVHFKNGKDVEIKGAHTFTEGAFTRVVDLPGGKRAITKITLRYSKASKQPAKIQVWAK